MITFKDIRQILTERPVIVPKVKTRYAYEIDVDSAKPRAVFDGAEGWKYVIEFTKSVAVISYAKTPGENATEENWKKVAKTVVIIVKDMVARKNYKKIKLITDSDSLQENLWEFLKKAIQKDFSAEKVIKL